MAHSRLVQISTAHAKTTGLLRAEVHKLRGAGVSAAAMGILAAIEGRADALANLNAEQGAIAHRIADEATVEDEPNGNQTVQ